MKKLFWSKWFTWLRKLLGANRPDIPWDKVLKETDAYAVAMGIEPAGERKFGYHTFSGVDVKFWIKPTDGRWTCLTETQGINCVYDDKSDTAEGSLILLVFDQDPIASLSPSTTYTILLEAANEYGHVAHAKFDRVKFGKRKWAISIDDLITEMKVEFEADSYKPWTSQESSPPPYTKEDIDRLKAEGRLDDLIQMRLDSR